MEPFFGQPIISSYLYRGPLFSTFAGHCGAIRRLRKSYCNLAGWGDGGEGCRTLFPGTRIPGKVQSAIGYEVSRRTTLRGRIGGGGGAGGRVERGICCLCLRTNTSARATGKKKDRKGTGCPAWLSSKHLFFWNTGNRPRPSLSPTRLAVLYHLFVQTPSGRARITGTTGTVIRSCLRAPLLPLRRRQVL